MLIFHHVIHAAERQTACFKSPLMQCSSGEAPGNNPAWLVPNGCRIQRVQVEATLHFPGRADQRQTLVRASEVIPEKQAGVEQKTEKTRRVWACSFWDYMPGRETPGDVWRNEGLAVRGVHPGQLQVTSGPDVDRDCDTEGLEGQSQRSAGHGVGELPFGAGQRARLEESRGESG